MQDNVKKSFPFLLKYLLSPNLHVNLLTLLSLSLASLGVELARIQERINSGERKISKNICASLAARSEKKLEILLCHAFEIVCRLPEVPSTFERLKGAF
jgi:hypothetical protein